MSDPSILIVDDDDRRAGQISACVHALGCIYDRATSLSEAFECLRKNTYVLVLCYAYLESDDALDLLREMKSNKEWQTIRVVFVSVDQSRIAQFVNTVSQSALKALGADDFISMPLFDPGAFADQLRSNLPAAI